jgi:hypothetical protein
MIKHFKKKAIALCFTAVIPFSSNALIPVTDYANLVENMLANMDQIYQWSEEKAMKMLEMESESLMQAMGVDNTNNGMANMIVRSGNAKQELQNLEIKEQSEPDDDACKTVTNQVLLGQVSCKTLDQVIDKTSESEEKHSNFGKSYQETKADASKIMNKIIDECNILQDGEFDENSPLKTSNCTKAGIFNGSVSGDSLSQFDQKAADVFVDLVSGPVPDFKESNKFENGSYAQNEVRVKELRKEAIRSLVNTSLNEIKSMRTSISETESTAVPSPLATLNKFNEDRFLDPDWVASVQNVNPGTKNFVTPTIIQRKLLVINSFIAHVELEQYKQQLRQEAILAALLAVEAEPL